MSKKGEIQYWKSHIQEKKAWLDKPFGHSSDFGKAWNMPSKHIRDFSNILQIVMPPLGNLKDKARVLDLGVGMGWTSIFLAKCGFHVVGIDISPDFIEVARENAQKEGVDIDFLVADNENYSSKEKFDLVLSYETLHHCENDVKIIKNCYQQLSIGGMLLLIEPFILHKYSSASKESQLKHDVLENGYSQRYLKKTLKEAGFKEIKRYYDTYRLLDDSLSGFIVCLLETFLHRFFVLPRKRGLNYYILAIK